MNNIKTAMLLALMAALFMAIGQYAGGTHGLIIAFVIAMATTFIGYWQSDKLVISMYNGQEVTRNQDPVLYDTVAKLAKNANIPMPKVYVIPTDMPNAFATGRNPSHAAVAVTQGIQRLLTQDEMEGVISHEIAHIVHRDTLISTVAAMIASAITMIANMLQFAAIFGGRSDDREGNGNPLALIAMIILAPLAASLIQMAISRSREYVADEGGARISGKPLALASALAKLDHYAKYGVLPHASDATAHMFIINPLSGVQSALNNLFSTHPSTAERIARLKEIAMRR